MKRFLTLILLSPLALAEPNLQITLSPPPAESLKLQWHDPTETHLLETSPDLKQWQLLDPSNYQKDHSGNFLYEKTDPLPSSAFFRTRKAGSSNIYIAGDSISTLSNWPRSLSQQIGNRIYTHAIGGTQSPSMVRRAQGVEFIGPTTAPTTHGTVQLRWNRHIADLTKNRSSTIGQWQVYPKSVSEPTRIEVYQNYQFVGNAKQNLIPFTTHYSASPKTIFAPNHGLQDGDPIAFISNDPNYPDGLSVNDSAALRSFSSPDLPANIIERRVYHVTNATSNQFELLEVIGDPDSMDLGGDSTGIPVIEAGWHFDLPYHGGPWNINWRSRTIYDDWIWLLEVSANDFPSQPANTFTIPNTQLLLAQMTAIQPRYLIICPPVGSYATRGPGTFAWTNYYETYMTWVRIHHPDHHIDTMAIFDAARSATEIAILDDPNIPEKVWLNNSGDPTNTSTWNISKIATPGSTESWIGPYYTPLHLRRSFTDNIHLNSHGNQILAEAIATKLQEKAWAE